MVPVILRQIPLFKNLDEAQLQALAALVVRRRFAKGELIILAEAEGDALFVIEEGQVKVGLIHEDGREVILSFLGSGEVFGELSLLDGKPRSASVTATAPTSLLVLRRPDFLHLLADLPQIAVSLLGELAERLRRTDQQLEGLALFNVASRLAKTLLRLALERGVEVPDGFALVDPPTHQQLANMTGSTRETVSRVLKQLESQGYIARNEGQILILREER
ncbi:MAG: Crp/Fnr family transcriptional regulator [Candidatus Latescibacteria bacterium]|nr:Crp/Fnr family transcriptional regulator [Candidatus Latescibacterota bacterium]